MNGIIISFQDIVGNEHYVTFNDLSKIQQNCEPRYRYYINGYEIDFDTYWKIMNMINVQKTVKICRC